MFEKWGHWERFGLLSLVAAALSACGGEEIRVRSDQAVALAVGDTLRLEDGGPRVTFTAVSEDSRCAKGVQCIWAGQAKVKLRIVGEVSKDYVLTVLGMKEKVSVLLEAAGLRIECRRLAPYPVDGVAIDPKSYKLTLSLSRL